MKLRLGDAIVISAKTGGNVWTIPGSNRKLDNFSKMILFGGLDKHILMTNTLASL
jgi:hypothetical protein